jgi:hypothetical protein
MFLQKNITQQQKYGGIVCLPKPNSIQKPEGYRPITPLNTYYKILARILANRLRPIVEDQLQFSQHCCVPGNTILEAVTTVLDAIAHAEMTDTSLCLLTLEFKNAFDRASHHYLFQILQCYEIGN